MQIQVLVQPGAKQDRVEKQIDLLGNEIYKVRTRVKPIEGEANSAVVSLLATYFGVKKYNVQLLHGGQARQKIFEIAMEKKD